MPALTIPCLLGPLLELCLSVYPIPDLIALFFLIYKINIFMYVWGHFLNIPKYSVSPTYFCAALFHCLVTWHRATEFNLGMPDKDVRALLFCLIRWLINLAQHCPLRLAATLQGLISLWSFRSHSSWGLKSHARDWTWDKPETISVTSTHALSLGYSTFLESGLGYASSHLLPSAAGRAVLLRRHRKAQR